jgi:Mor family transcriptional regulator
VLGLDVADVAAYLAHTPPRGCRPRGRPHGPPRRPWTSLGRRPPIRGQNGSKIRVLLGLGYEAMRIAAVLRLRVDDVEDFIRRNTPRRLGALKKRLRERCEQAALRPTLPRFIAPELEPIAADWNWRERPVAAVALPAAIVPAVELDQVVEADIEARKKSDDARCINATVNGWVGPSTFAERPGGQPKLNEDQARDVIRARASGESMYSLAARYKVARNTIYAIVNGKTYALRDLFANAPSSLDDAPPSPPPLIGDGDETARTE